MPDASLAIACRGANGATGGTGTGRDHRLCFSPITAATAVFARAAGAAA